MVRVLSRVSLPLLRRDISTYLISHSLCPFNLNLLPVASCISLLHLLAFTELPVSFLKMQHSQLAPLPNDVPFRIVSKTIGQGAYAW